MTLAEATESYQAYLEGHRMWPDDDDIWQGLVKAKQAMEVAWLAHQLRPEATRG